MTIIIITHYCNIRALHRIYPHTPLSLTYNICTEAQVLAEQVAKVNALMHQHEQRFQQIASVAGLTNPGYCSLLL